LVPSNFQSFGLDRCPGVITRPGRKLESAGIVDKPCLLPTAKGGSAAGWAF